MKPLLVALGLVLVSASVSHAQDTNTSDSAFHRYLTGVVVAQSLDNLTTQLAMTPYVEHGQLVAYGERNPLLPANRGANAVAQALITAGTVLVLHKIEPSHPRLARVLALSLTGLGVQDTVHNWRCLMRR